MGDVPSGGSTSGRWQPVAADFVMPKDAAPAPRVDGKRAMQYVRETVGVRFAPHRQPRAPQARRLYPPEARGSDTLRLPMTPSPPKPPPVRIPYGTSLPSFRARKTASSSSPATTTPTCRLPKTYVGANDGGSSTGLLLEMADVLRGRQMEGYSVWLVWLDGEEATVHWTDTDSLYGSRHLAQLWQQDGTAKKIKAFLLLDMVGDADLNIDRDLNSTVWLEDVVQGRGHPAGLPVALLRPAARRRRRSPAVRQNRCPGGRSHRLRLRLRQRLLAHPAGHARQTQPQQPANRRRHGAGNHPGTRRALKHFRLKIVLDFRFQRAGCWPHPYSPL